MGRCHVLYDLSFCFVLAVDHSSPSISSFLKFVPFSNHYLDGLSYANGALANSEAD